MDCGPASGLGPLLLSATMLLALHLLGCGCFALESLSPTLRSCPNSRERRVVGAAIFVPGEAFERAAAVDSAGNIAWPNKQLGMKRAAAMTLGL